MRAPTSFCWSFFTLAFLHYVCTTYSGLFCSTFLFLWVPVKVGPPIRSYVPLQNPLLFPHIRALHVYSSPSLRPLLHLQSLPSQSVMEFSLHTAPAPPESYVPGVIHQDLPPVNYHLVTVAQCAHTRTQRLDLLDGMVLQTTVVNYTHECVCQHTHCHRPVRRRCHFRNAEVRRPIGHDNTFMSAQRQTSRGIEGASLQKVEPR